MNTSVGASGLNAAARAAFVRSRLPEAGLFAGQDWRIAAEPFPLPLPIAEELESLGRVLLQFYRAVNLLYRQSIAGKQPAWVSAWLDQGKPADLIALQRSPAFKNEVPRVIRPDLLLLEDGLGVTELDSVPGGIGLTGWLNQVYSELQVFSPTHRIQGAVTGPESKPAQGAGMGSTDGILGGADGMIRGFESIFGEAPEVHIVVSQEASTYRPEMEWMARQAGPSRFHVRDSRFTGFRPGDAAYRFFELFDLANVENAQAIFDMAVQGQLHLTPPPKPIFEEKMIFALLWNRHLHAFWRRELGEKFFERLLRLTPYTWLVDPTPLPPHGAIPELNLTDWQQLKTLSQRERDLILKVSGFAETAWGARGVYLGSDLSVGEWSAAVDEALRAFERSPFVLQRYYKPRVVESAWYDFAGGVLTPLKGRVRLCPFYFVAGQGDAARAKLGGVLATICPADKKIIHGMKEAILAPCAYETP